MWVKPLGGTKLPKKCCSNSIKLIRGRHTRRDPAGVELLQLLPCPPSEVHQTQGACRLSQRWSNMAAWALAPQGLARTGLRVYASCNKSSTPHTQTTQPPNFSIHKLAAHHHEQPRHKPLNHPRPLNTPTHSPHKHPPTPFFITCAAAAPMSGVMPVADRLLRMLLLTAGPNAAMEPRASTMKITQPMARAPAHTAFISAVLCLLWKEKGGVQAGVGRCGRGKTVVCRENRVSGCSRRRGKAAVFQQRQGQASMHSRMLRNQTLTTTHPPTTLWYLPSRV